MTTRRTNVHSIFRIQTVALNVFGLWSRGDHENPLKGCTLGRIRRFIYLFLIIPATPISLYLVIRSIAALAGDAEKSNPKERPVVHALALVPSIVIAIRGICILLLLSVSRVDLKSLIRDLELMVGAAVPKEKATKYMKRWSVFNTIAVIYCVGAFFPVCILNGFHTAESLYTAMNGTVVLKPFDVAIPVWSYVLLEAVFSWFPYVLSQMVLLCIVTSSLVLYDCFASLNESLQGLEAKLPMVVGKEKQLEAELNWTGSCIEMDVMTDDVESLLKVRAGLFHFVHLQNHNLGFVILLSYLADICAAAGMLTILVTHEEETSVSFPAKLIGTIVFMSYATVLYIPMVLATETAGDTNLILYQITIKGYSLIKAQLGNSLGNALADFRQLVTMFPVHYSAARIFHIDRNFLVATFSLLFTFAVLLEELLGQMSVKALVEQSTNTSSLLEAVLNNATLGNHTLRPDDNL